MITNSKIENKILDEFDDEGLNKLKLNDKNNSNSNNKNNSSSSNNNNSSSSGNNNKESTSGEESDDEHTGSSSSTAAMELHRYKISQECPVDFEDDYDEESSSFDEEDEDSAAEEESNGGKLIPNPNDKKKKRSSTKKTPSDKKSSAKSKNKETSANPIQNCQLMESGTLFSPTEFVKSSTANPTKSPVQPMKLSSMLGLSELGTSNVLTVQNPQPISEPTKNNSNSNNSSNTNNSDSNSSNYNNSNSNNSNGDSTKVKTTTLNSWDAPPLANVLPDPSYCQDIVDSENNFIVPSVKHTILDVDNLFNNLIQNNNSNTTNNDFKSSTMIGKPFSSGDGSTSPLISGLSTSSIIPNGNINLTSEQQQQQQGIPESEIPIDIKVLQLSGSRMFFNRELSELIYFYRILYEAYNPTYPILERVRFIAITSQNLDMYFCKRALKLRLGYISTRKTLKPEEHYINMVLNTTRNLINEIYNLYMNILAPELSNNNVFIIKYSDLTEPEKVQLRGFFLQHVFPLMTPLVVDAGHPFPNLSNLSLNIAVLLKHDEDTTRFVRIKVPQRIPRFVHIKQRSNYSIIPMEEIILANLDTLFPNTKILTKSLFRVSRHNDLKLSGEDQANDLLELIKTELHKRKFAPMVRLEVSHNMPAEILDMLKTQLALDAYDVYVINGPLGLQDLFELCKLNLPHLKFQPWVPHIPSRLVNLAKYPSEDIFSVIRKGELLVNLPYLSFNSSVQFFIESAVKDPKVLAIKIAIYRTNSNSQLIRALCEAASHKEVMVLVDLKASGDEEQNTKFARLLEQAGCHVSYGLVGLKTHAKIAMVVREEENGLREYLNISTGNYNASTSDVYADICLFSCDPDLGEDMCNLFNYLTGYSRVSSFKKLLIAPMNMRSTLIQLIDNEAKNAREGKDATINAVMNGLDDKRLVNALYQASIAGVKITLVVRGRCRILPGIKGISENIKVISILGRFLEHSRIYCFHNNGKPKGYIASADWLHRNLKRRVEVMVPVDDANNIKQLYEIINVYCNDSNAWEMLSDGRYKKRSSPIDEDSQTQFMKQTNQKHPVICHYKIVNYKQQNFQTDSSALILGLLINLIVLVAIINWVYNLFSGHSSSEHTKNSGAKVASRTSKKRRDHLEEMSSESTNKLKRVLDNNDADDIDEEDGDVSMNRKFESMSEDEETPGMCCECTDQPSVVLCVECKDELCEVCSISIHRRGSRRSHTFKNKYNVEFTFEQLNSGDQRNPPLHSKEEIQNNHNSSSNNNNSNIEMDDNNNKNSSSISSNNNINSSLNSMYRGTSIILNPLPFHHTNQQRNGGGPNNHQINNHHKDEDQEIDEDEEKFIHKNENFTDFVPKLSKDWFIDRSKYIPVRLNIRERNDLRLLEAALHVSEYTDKIDIIHVGGSKSKRINEQLRSMCAILSGLLVASDFKKGQQLVENKDFFENEEFFQNVFEIGRRHKIMNPAKMRTEYGKMIHLLQDAADDDVKKNLSGLNMIKPLKTVYLFLSERNGLKLLEDPLLELATREVLADNKSRPQIQREIREKEHAIKTLSRRHSSSLLRSEEIEVCIYSICDNHTFLRENRDPVKKMKRLLKEYFDPNHSEKGFSLALEHGVGGARLSHNHRKQYNYVYQSLSLWQRILHDMFKLWYLAEIDLLGGHRYQLSNTGQGLNRIQPCPNVGKMMHSILRQTQQKVGDDWVGSSVIHLGDHNVPNSLVFIDKYTQISRILSPIILTIEYIPKITDPNLIAYIKNTFGSVETLTKIILCDFFKHAFDGSGADNFFDAGSCIDGRLTSAWQWSAQIAKKPYYPIFLLAGFSGFDGSFN
ncbi:hypothetical protein ACTFIV_006715 [Dictyostelium citrinum]